MLVKFGDTDGALNTALYWIGFIYLVLGCTEFGFNRGYERLAYYGCLV